MKKFVGLLVTVLIVLALSSVAFAGTDFTLEFAQDFDAEETSGFAKLGYSLAKDPFNFSLTYTRDILPDPADTLLGKIDLTFGDLKFGYERKLTVDDPGVGTANFVIGPISLGYTYEFADDRSGKIIATYSKSF